MKNWSSFKQEKKILTYIQYGENGNLCISGVETLFHRRFFSLVCCYVNALRHLQQLFPRKNDKLLFHSTHRFFNSCLSFAFYAVAIVMPARPPEPGKRKQHKQFCHRSSRAAMPSSMVVSRLPVKSARHRKEMVSSFSPVLWARAHDPRPRPPSAPRSPAQVRAHTSLTSLAITSCSRGHILSWTALMRISSSITGRDIYRVLKINASPAMERN